MGMFSGISEAKYSEGGNYIKPGVFRLKVSKCIGKKLRTNKQAFIVEFNVIESDNAEHRVGSEVTWMVTMDKEPALGNIRQFIAAVMEVDIEEVNEEVAELVVGEDNPLASKIVRASAVNITTKAGKPFTKVKFLSDSIGDAGMKKAHAENT